MKFIFGKEEYLVNLKVKEFLKSFSIDIVNIYDESIKIDNIIMDILTIPMFSDKKVIVIKDHSILTDKNEGLKFLKEFRNANKNNLDLLFVLNSEPQKTNPFIKYLFKNAEIQEIKELISRDIPKTIRQLVNENGGIISDGAIIKLFQKLPTNLRIIVNEVKKLLFESKNITESIVAKSIDDYHSEDYFAFSNAIIEKNKIAIIKYYNEKLLYGIQPISIIFQIASTLNLSILVDNYKKQGYSLKEISEELKIHTFRIKKANELILDWDFKKIEDLIIKLANLETNIKSGKVDNLRGLDRFILQLIK